MTTDTVQSRLCANQTHSLIISDWTCRLSRKRDALKHWNLQTYSGEPESNHEPINEQTCIFNSHDQKQQIQKLQSMTVIQDSTLHQVDCQAKKKSQQL